MTVPRNTVAHTARILVVDDEDSLRRLIATVLTRGGYEVVTAENGKQAVQFVEKQAYDLVITDLVMPEQEGIETIVALRRSYPAIKIIAMSGGGQNAADSYLTIAEKLGAIGTLAKPFGMDELLNTVRLALES